MREMTLGQAAVILLCICCLTAAASVGPVGLAPLAADDECSSATGSSQECTLSALQRRGARLSSEEPWPDAELEIPAEALVLAELGPGPSSFSSCGGEAYDLSKQGCCDGVLYSRTSQGCCGGKSVYSYSSEGCCDEQRVYKFGSESCVPSAPSAGSEDSSTHFECSSTWPPVKLADYWRRYCASNRHMAWAMTTSCSVAYPAVHQRSSKAAEHRVLAACGKKAGENCHIFDLDGSACHRQRCGEEIYDGALKGCCGGKVYDLQTEGCCSGAVFDARSDGCCQGEIYSRASNSCCGGKQLYDSSTHGCCLNHGAQVYPFGTHNCCFHPAGVCKIPKGRPSCCH
eukprot:gb/GFBE01025693.1/.p1 GENE.gb/GFBE01025693.1/~~gb/GFBE01025693.1/.p1  ORF type:complete len:343 (+),score=58.76 gb/GFBE01025693.1/:1-1029(+)